MIWEGRVPTNSYVVPAVAEIRGGQVLFIVIGRKVYVGGPNKFLVQLHSVTVVNYKHIFIGTRV